MLLLWCAVVTVLAGQAAVSAIQLDINDPSASSAWIFSR